jgi:hypothetical protein
MDRQLDRLMWLLEQDAQIVCGEVEAEIDVKIINGKEYEFIKSISKSKGE